MSRRPLLAALLLLLPSCTHQPPQSPSPHLLYSDPFTYGLSLWTPELQQPARTLSAHDGQLEIDVPAGCTLWFNQPLHSPVTIEYTATLISHGGPNDRVSDLNCFWMARDARSPSNLFATPRTGKFSDYNQLLTYYVGLGGNTNTTTRFRRYVGSPSTRPLLPQHDLRSPADLLLPNTPTHIKLVADGPTIQYWRDGRLLFNYHDPHPYTSGHFALRTTHNHMIIQNFRISRPN